MNNTKAVEVPEHAVCPLVALVGNPNTGKTSVFNMLTGAHHRVANYPGVTVERVTGRILDTTKPIELLDLPGTYSLAARSPDEMIVTDSLLGRQAGVGEISAVVVVVDASNLDRNLFLVAQIMETGLPVVVALNMIDVAKRHGITVNRDVLEKHLGIPVIPIVARHNENRADLTAAIEQSLSSVPATTVCHWPASIEESIDELAEAIRQRIPGGRQLPRFELRQCLLGIGGYAEKRLLQDSPKGLGEVLTELRNRLTASGLNIPSLEAELRYEWIGEIIDSVRVHNIPKSRRGSDRIDDFLTHRLFGSVAFVVIMGAVFMGVFTGSMPLMNGIDSVFHNLSGVIQRTLPGGVLASFLADGLVGGVGGVLAFLPQILILFALITALEDCGYLARAAFLMDRILRVFGLGGRSFVPLLSSFACTIPGIMAARTIEHPRDRLATILVAPLMTCSARIPIYTLMVAAFVPPRMIGGFLPLQGVVFTMLYLIGIIAAGAMAWLFRRTLFRSEEAPFLLELPSYKVPSLRAVLLRVVDRGRSFVISAGTIILAMSIIVWAMSYFPRPASLAAQTRTELVANGETNEATISHTIDGAYLRQSYLARMGKYIEPAIRPLGWDWRIGMATIAAFPAREVVISTMNIIYNLGPEVDEETSALTAKLHASTWPDGRKVFTLPVALSIVVFFALCCQCQATLAVIRRETGSWGWTGFAFGYMTALAYVAALAVYQIGTLLS